MQKIATNIANRARLEIALRSLLGPHRWLPSTASDEATSVLQIDGRGMAGRCRHGLIPRSLDVVVGAGPIQKLGLVTKL